MTPESTALPTAWRVPVARNIHFTGREDALVSLRKRLMQPDNLSRVQVLCGPGGIGKTQLAAEYVHRFRSVYGIIWWVSAEDLAGPEVGLAELARTLRLSEQSNMSAADLRRMLFRHLSRRDDWLLIFDNAPDSQAIAGMIPPERMGHVIVTSRNPNWNEIGRPFPLNIFDRRESIAFLQRRTNRNEKPETLDALAKALGDMPLALDQAAALIEQTRISFDDYLRRFEGHWGDLLSKGKPSNDYPMSVAMSWELSFKQLEETSPHAAELLAICACFSTDGIPRRLLRAAAPFVPAGLDAVLNEPLLCAEAVGHLVRYSLVDADEYMIRIHPIGAGLARDRLSESERKQWATIAVRTMQSLFNFEFSSARSWQELATLLPHALSSAHHADQLGVSRDMVRSIYNEAGHYLLEQAHYDHSRQLLERAMEIVLELWGPNNPRISPIANNLGRVLIRTSEYATAREFFERALVLDEKSYGSSHPHVAELLNNRGICRHTLGDKDGAEEDFRRALEIYNFTYGEEHAKIASILNNLGYTHAGKGDFANARAQLTQALHMAQTTLGVVHPTVAAVLRNLGNVCHYLGQPRQARTCFEKACEIDEQILGPDHPDVASDLAGWGESLEAIGELEAAKRQLNRSVTIEEAARSPDRGNLVERYQALAHIHRDLGETEEARRCMGRIAQLENVVSSEQQIDVPAPLRLRAIE